MYALHALVSLIFVFTICHHDLRDCNKSCIKSISYGHSLKYFQPAFLLWKNNSKKLVDTENWFLNWSLLCFLISLKIFFSRKFIAAVSGLCAFSPSSEGCYLALPASTTKGSVLVYNTVELQSLCQVIKDMHLCSPPFFMLFQIMLAGFCCSSAKDICHTL